jgi:tRNA-Thr(GGU) m(6)t(6)A37 methyltransferase TsaA
MNEPPALRCAVHPIGRVLRGRPPGSRDDEWERAEAEIEIEPAWAGGLDGLEAFSHIWVIWWLDRAAVPPPDLHVRPEKRAEMPLVGLFATRSPSRPNPIGLTAVRLLERRGHLLRVLGLDAYAGTPVLDIKPYLRRGDLLSDATVAPWLEQLWQIHEAGRASCAEDELRRA